ncbi:MAG: hypothetical protein U9M95_03280 [Candidatus Altiarchaeota archaeon]|nr:hypothetical protein [Candidatus Altiarchaeota archaeon]
MFNAEEKRELKKITELYGAVKTVILKAEEISGVSDTQVINELRHAFDHFMRITSVKLEIVPDDDLGEDYIKDNFKKTYGHVYRSGYDALDWVTLIIRDDMIDIMKQFPLETINEVCPEYYREIKADVEQISNEIASIRAKKDVGIDHFDNFLEYVELMKRLENHNITLTSKVNAMTEYTDKLKKEKRKEQMINIAIGIVIGLSVGGIVFIASTLL